MKMNTIFVMGLITLSSVVSAKAATVVGTGRASAISTGCATPYYLGNVNFPQAIASATQDAEAKCNGKATRISAYAMDLGCVVTRVRGATVISATVSSEFRCE